MTASEYIKELSRAFDYQEYDRIQFYADTNQRILFPYLVGDKTFSPSEIGRVLGDFYGLVQERKEDYPRANTPCPSIHRLQIGIPDHEYRLYLWLVNPTKEFDLSDESFYKVYLISESAAVHFFIPYPNGGLSTSLVLEKIQKVYTTRMPSHMWYHFAFTPEFVRENNLGFYSYKALFDLTRDYYEDPLVFLCLRYLVDKSPSKIQKLLSEFMKQCSCPQDMRVQKRRKIISDKSMLKKSTAIYEYEWKSHVRVQFEAAKYLFVNDEQMEVWKSVISFCKCDKIEPAGTAKPFFSKHWGDAALDRLWIYLKDTDQISRTTPFDMMRYYFGGGRGVMPEGKIQWIGTDNNVIHALIDTFDAGTHGKWERAAEIFDINPPIELSSKRATSVRRDNNKEYNDGPKKLTPYKNYLKAFKGLKNKSI